jgi:ABC-type sulfate/molybdate transport systems ATPase subunit
MMERGKNTNLYIDIIKNLSGFKLSVQLEIRAEKAGLLGASGSGKSMTLRCIAGIERPDTGQIVLGDEVLFDSKKGINKPPRERKVGYLFQNYALFPHMTVEQNIMSGMLGLTKKEQLLSKNQLMQDMHLSGLEKRFPKQLSGGQAQRAAIARMLGARPNILMFDEPFSALDYHLKEQLQQQLLDLLEEKNMPTLIVSHDIDEAYRLCDKIAIIENGKIDLFDTKKEVFERPAKLSAAQMTGCKNISRLQWLTDYEALALEWDIVLEIPKQAISNTSKRAEYIGIRAHHLMLTDEPGENAFPYKLIRINETRFEMTVLVKIQGEDRMSEEPLRIEISKKEWQQVNKENLPKYIKIPSNRLILLEN